MTLTASADLPGPPIVTARRLQLFTQNDAIVLMHRDCAVCRSEGHAPKSQVLLVANGREVMATLYQTGDSSVADGEAGLSEAAWTRLGVEEGDPVVVRHPPTIQSMSNLRRRIFGDRFEAEDLRAIVADIAAGRYSDVHLAAFITACSAWPLSLSEVTQLTRAMVNAGQRLSWPPGVIIDKHCVGGLPGNRTSPIVVAILAAHGLVAPKTSSRAITSPAGTADVMETLTRVDLTLEEMRKVVERESGCLVWGGAVDLSPTDDLLLKVERVLDIDTEGQLVASVLSKKIAAGSTHVVIDIPVGPTAKVRSVSQGERLSSMLKAVGDACGIEVESLLTDGSQPVGRGIGPALEAWDVLAVLQGADDAPADLTARATLLAGAALELAGAARPEGGVAMAMATIADGRAWSKFQRICEAQGGLRAPPRSLVNRPILAQRSGRVAAINNRTLARLAKLAGAPDDKAAGVALHARLGDQVAAGQPLLTVHADAPGELAYALHYAAANPDIMEIEG